MNSVSEPRFNQVADVESALASQGYIADRALATALFLALRLQKPLLLEGEAGVGKTEVAVSIAKSRGSELIRVQGYEGIDAAAALYDWNYPRQILAIRTAESTGQRMEVADLFSSEFLIQRPILRALESRETVSPVLLIDEVDRADDEFEAFLLEVLSDFQVTIPEIGTIKSQRPPLVILTSNRTREIHDALKRRCIYHWIEYPVLDKEVAILQSRVPDIDEDLRRQVASFVQDVRRLDLYKAPGMAETIDWARALSLGPGDALGREEVGLTLGVLLKNQEDIDQVLSNLDAVIPHASKG